MIDLIVYNIMWIKKIKDLLKDGDPYFQEDIRRELNNPDRAILTGYLRCLVEIGEIKSKTRGVAKVYFLNKRKGKTKK